ncbi:ATP-binding protein [Streptomyces sp. NPDC049954]|uniref:ATP-binding protein n=1 Tax=Streptomyces sp. NPDC049954 TaxID=3155779 RepID=UPI0034496FDC
MTGTMTEEQPGETAVAPSAQSTFRAVEESVSEARSFARAHLRATATTAGREAADRLEDVVLVVSELVTNAVRYGSEPGDSFRLVLETAPGRVLVEVHDTCRRAPRRKSESAERQRGRGLFIVDALATWGVRDRPFGKIVWAVVEW